MPTDADRHPGDRARRSIGLPGLAVLGAGTIATLAPGVAVAAPAPVCTAGTCIVTFSTVGPDIFTVPDGVGTVDITAIGGRGASNDQGGAGGLGAMTSANGVAVTGGEVLDVFVAGDGSGRTGGAGGGGDAATGELFDGRGGGGASSVARGIDRLIVAGGGGGAGSDSIAAGGAAGTDGARGSGRSAGEGGQAAIGTTPGAGGTGDTASQSGEPGLASGTGGSSVESPSTGGGGGGGLAGGGAGGGGVAGGGSGGGGGGSSTGSPTVTELPAAVVITYADPDPGCSGLICLDFGSLGLPS